VTNNAKQDHVWKEHETEKLIQGLELYGSGPEKLQKMGYTTDRSYKAIVKHCHTIKIRILEKKGELTAREEGLLQILSSGN
jgi:hypothetical protein